MTYSAKAVKEFHEKFKQAYDGPPRQLEANEAMFRTVAMLEEVNEYMAAVLADDLEGQLDALVDLSYFVYGTAYRQGLPLDEAFYRVHVANMTKVNAETSSDSKRGYEMDIVKPEGFEPPVLTDLVLDK